MVSVVVIAAIWFEFGRSSKHLLQTNHPWTRGCRPQGTKHSVYKSKERLSGTREPWASLEMNNTNNVPVHSRHSADSRVVVAAAVVVLSSHLGETDGQTD